MSKVSELKELLFDTLTEQLKNGVTVVTKEGEEKTVDAGAAVLAVAAKVIKDWADEAKDDEKQAAQSENLQRFLDRRRPDLATKPN